MNLLILEDNLMFQQRILNAVRECFPKAKVTVQSSPCLLHDDYDGVVVDIDLNAESDGISFVRMNASRLRAVLYYSICFERIKEAFGPKVLGFIEKDDPQEILYAKLLEMRRYLDEECDRLCVFDQLGRSHLLFFRNISSIQRISRKRWAFDEDGNKYRLMDMEWEKKKSGFGSDFIWINQSELVNLSMISWEKNKEIKTKDGRSLYISRNYYPDFIKYWRGIRP